MRLRHILVAVDRSEAGGAALRTALDLARRTSARLTGVHAVPSSRATTAARAGAAQPSDLLRDELTRWAAAVGADATDDLRVDITSGSPGIEIPRYAEQLEADLIVLGRSPAPAGDRLLGSTAESVARRSRLPCLFVSPGVPPIRRILVALDGTLRAFQVTATAGRLARNIGASLQAVTVRRCAEESVSPPPPPAVLTETGSLISLKVRYGEVVEQVLAEIEASRPDALAIGYRRGGPPARPGIGGTGPRLAQAVRCALITVPL